MQKSQQILPYRNVEILDDFLSKLFSSSVVARPLSYKTKTTYFFKTKTAFFKDHQIQDHWRSQKF